MQIGSLFNIFQVHKALQPKHNNRFKIKKKYHKNANLDQMPFLLV